MSASTTSPFVAAITRLRTLFPDADVTFLSYPNHPKRETQFLFCLDFGQPTCVTETVTITAKDTARAGNDRALTELIRGRVENAVRSLIDQTGRFLL